MNDAEKKLIEKFLCPGCVYGPHPGECEAFAPIEGNGAMCGGHVLGTMMSRVGHIALGLPKGFCRPGPNDALSGTRSKMEIRLWVHGTKPAWNHLNVPVWAMVQDGFLFVRTYCPRVNHTYVDVIEAGEFPNGAIDVAKFSTEID